MSEQQTRQYVLAGSYGQFRHYCQMHHKDPIREATYVYGEESLMGVPRGGELIEYGTPYYRRDYHAILASARARDMQIKRVVSN